jgi:serine/threonine protein kinase
MPPPSGLSTLPLPGAAKAAREYLSELVNAGLLSQSTAEAFVKDLGPPASQLTTRERTADALVALGLMTRYQATRVLNGLIRGLVLGPYHVLDRISSGSVGVVFLAEHETLRRRVAVKVLSAEATTPVELVDRFKAEMRVMSGLDHPHIVPVYDAGVVEGPGQNLPTLHYFVLELIPGGDLENYVYANGPQPLGLVCEWGRQVATALRAVHTAGLVHRDVKPSNLLLTNTRGLKLIDFGLVREYAAARTRPDTLLGSIEFIAPEQIEDAAIAGPPADVYSLGATLFWLLSGQLPYPKVKSARDAIATVRSTPPRKLKQFCPDAPAALEALLGKLLARNPADRPSPAEAAASLAGFAVPSTHPVLGSTPAPSDDETGHLRFAVRQLEEELVTTVKTLDAARAAVFAGLAAASVVRPGETVDHQRRMAEYVRLLAVELSKTADWPMFADPRTVEDLARAAAAHDLGLVGVPDHLLLTPNKLTAAEREKFVAHPAVGAAVLDVMAKAAGSAFPGLRVARAVVRHHHERWDGSGYPDRLSGKAIPPSARVVAVADAYDTLRTGYPGRPGISHPDAVAAIVRQSGVAFDPAVVRAFGATAATFDTIFKAQEPPAFEEIREIREMEEVEDVEAEE